MTSENDPVLELGMSLADALDTSDIIGRWMAHHLADLITRSEADPNDQDLSTETREVILKFWEHKAGGRFKRTPLDHVQPVLAALARLEPDPPPWAHFRALSPDGLPSTDDLARSPLLAAACDMDRDFGRLVRLAVALAGKEALDREEPWVVAATAVAETEVDHALQQFQKWIHANRRHAALRHDLVPPCELLEQSSEVAKHANSTSADKHGQPSSDDEVLSVALKAMISQCTKLLERMDHLIAAPDPVPGPMTSVAVDDTSEGRV